MKNRVFLSLSFFLIALSGRAQTQPNLNLTRAGASLQTSWSDPSGVLQQADLPQGPWDLLPTLSPYLFPPTNHAKFFRLVHGAGGDILGSLTVTVPLGPAQNQIR